MNTAEIWGGNWVTNIIGHALKMSVPGASTQRDRVSSLEFNVGANGGQLPSVFHVKTTTQETGKFGSQKSVNRYKWAVVFPLDTQTDSEIPHYRCDQKHILRTSLGARIDR